MKTIAQTRRLIIKQFLPGEEATYLNHFEDAEVLRHIPRRTRDERRQIFQNALSQYTAPGICGTWGIFSQSDNSFSGSCLLRYFESETDTLELGYSFERKNWGKGFGTEIASAMVARALGDTSIMAIVAVTTLKNTASQRVLEKAGFKRQDNILRGGEEVAFFKIKK